MIVTVAELMTLPEFQGQSSSTLQTMLEAAELMIRKYTNNNFQNRNIRFNASSEGSILNGSSTYLKVGDTVQISESGVNDGIYTVSAVGSNTTTIDKTLFAVENNLVTKIEYPADIKMGVINLMKWEVTNRSKVGIQSETISRHSVTYFNQDANNQTIGYPVSLTGFLKPYMKARF